MKKSLLFMLMLSLTGIASAATDHYVLRDNNHVFHLKISKVGDEVKASAEVDFEPNADEAGKHACTAHVSGEAKFESDTLLVLKKQMEGERHFCILNIQLSPKGAKIEQSKDCSYFAAGLCHFDTQGKELVKFQ